MKIRDFAQLVSTSKGGVQVMVGENLSLTVPKELTDKVGALLDRSTVHTFVRKDGSNGVTGKLGIVELDFRPSQTEGLGFLTSIERSEFAQASAADIFGNAPAESAPAAEVVD